MENEVAGTPWAPAGTMDAGEALEAARTGDAAWRREQAQQAQLRIDRAARLETLGVWVVTSPLLLPVVFVLCGGVTRLRGLLRLPPAPHGGVGVAIMVGAMVMLMVLGLVLHRAARIFRRQVVAQGREQGLDIIDPGDDRLFSGRAPAGRTRERDD